MNFKLNELPKSNFQSRIISGFFLLFFSFISFYLGKFTFNFFISFCSFFLFFEVCEITLKKSSKSFIKKILISFFSSLVPFLFFFDYKVYLIIVFLVILISLVEPKSKLIRTIIFIYIFLSLVAFQGLLKNSYLENNFFDIYFVLTIVIATDIGAYIFGNIFGGKKILPHISPNKTFSGSIGGIIMSLLICFFFFEKFEISIISLMLTTFFLSIFAQLGDIAESFFKRYHNVKDSGFLIPGHGGFFDRFDSLLSAILCYYIIINFIIG